MPALIYNEADIEQFARDLDENCRRKEETKDWKEILDLTLECAELRFKNDFGLVDYWVAEKSTLDPNDSATEQLGLAELGTLTNTLYSCTESTKPPESSTLAEFLRHLLVDSELLKSKIESERKRFAEEEDLVRKQYAILTRERRLLDGRTDSEDELEQAASRLIEERITEPVKRLDRELTDGAEELLKRRHTLVYALLYGSNNTQLAAEYALVIELPQTCKDLAELYGSIDAGKWPSVEERIPKCNRAAQIVPCSLVLESLLENRADLALTYLRTMANNTAMDASAELTLRVYLSNNLIQEALELSRSTDRIANESAPTSSTSGESMKLFFSTCVGKQLYRKVFTLGLTESEVECMKSQLLAANRWDLMVLYYIQHGNISEALEVYKRMDASHDTQMAPEQRKQLDGIVQSVKKMVNAGGTSDSQRSRPVPNISDDTEMSVEPATPHPARIEFESLPQSASLIGCNIAVDTEITGTPMDNNATSSSRLRKPREIRNVSSTPHRYNSRSNC